MENEFEQPVNVPVEETTDAEPVVVADEVQPEVEAQPESTEQDIYS